MSNENEKTPLYVSEVFINGTKGYQFGESGIYEAYTDDIGKLFRSMQKEYGRCIGKVYIDTKDEKAHTIGWVFSKRMKYEDARDNSPDSFYTREVWVTLHEKPDTITRTRHFRYIDYPI